MVFLRRIRTRSICLLLASFVTPSFVRADSLTELKLKAAFIYNFTKFVKWPESAFSSPGAPLTICAVGDESVREVLDDTVRDKKADSHPLAVRHAKTGSDLNSCQIVFVQARELPRLAGWLSTETRPGVLTISEVAALSDTNAHVAIITFVPDSNRIRFAISTKLAEKAGMEISSRLLSLAMSVDR